MFAEKLSFDDVMNAMSYIDKHSDKSDVWIRQDQAGSIEIKFTDINSKDIHIKLFNVTTANMATIALKQNLPKRKY